MALPTVTIIGTVKFMETKFLQSGKQVTSLMVSCSDKRKDGTYDNLNIKAEFWEASAKFVNDFFNDGDPIIVTGKLITDSFETNGQKRHDIKFHFPQANFVPKPQANNGQANKAPQQQQQQQQQVQQQYQAPQTTYQNQQGNQVTQQQYNQTQQSYQPQQQQVQMPNAVPSIDVDSDTIPF